MIEIRKVKYVAKTELVQIADIWLKANLDAHHFIAEEYWHAHYSEVMKLLEDAELWVSTTCEGEINGFLGMMEENYIAGLFIEKMSRRRGLGKNLLKAVKKEKEQLRLAVYQKNKEALNFYYKQGFMLVGEELEHSTQERESHLIWRKKKVDFPECICL